VVSRAARPDRYRDGGTGRAFHLIQDAGDRAGEAMIVPQPALEPLRRWDPERIGPYVLLGRLGAGAMGQVFLGRSTAGRLVAVKTIRIELADEAGFRARFAHEVAAARRVSGAFTAAVVAANPEAEMPWLATAYIPAPSLAALVKACGPLPVPATRWLAAGCAEALESIHSAGLVHRDLKPSNVLVAADGPRVIDFGVARATERIQLTVTRGAVGTPAYMAPEQARDTRQASVASDVFSLGATLMFAATGHAPYNGETVMDILVRLATEPPDLTGLPAELAGLIGSCLERSPRRRPTSAALLAQLGPFVGAAAGPGNGQPDLPGPALALIADYQRGPAPPLRAQDTETQGTDDDSEDATFGSHTALPAHPAVRPRTNRRRFPRSLATLAALAGGAAALVGAGVLLGALVTGGTAAAPSSPAATGGFPNPPPGPPPSAFPQTAAGAPAVVMLQQLGDGTTVFLVHGTGWVPTSHVTVTLPGHGVSPISPVVDRQGTFNYAINQGHEFFAGQIPAGVYQVVVTAPGRRHARTSFDVVRPPTGSGPVPSSP
jgi:serine/threonine protein kinase